MIPGCHCDRAKRHQHIDRQRSGVTLGKRLKPLGLLPGQLAVLYQPGDVENDLDNWPPSGESTRHVLREFELPLEDAPESVIG
jgi:hypothetical protein